MWDSSIAASGSVQQHNGHCDTLMSLDVQQVYFWGYTSSETFSSNLNEPFHFIIKFLHHSSPSESPQLVFSITSSRSVESSWVLQARLGWQMSLFFSSKKVQWTWISPNLILSSFSSLCQVYGTLGREGPPRIHSSGSAGWKCWCPPPRLSFGM